MTECVNLGYFDNNGINPQIVVSSGNIFNDKVYIQNNDGKYEMCNNEILQFADKLVTSYSALTGDMNTVSRYAVPLTYSSGGISLQ